MQDIDIPSGVAELGYGEEDVDDLVEGAMKQQRLLVIAPVEVGPAELAAIFRESMANW
jgi:alcohol dehydrogenase class IV